MGEPRRRGHSSAEQAAAADAQKRPLRSRFRARLSRSVRDAPIKTGRVLGVKVPDEEGLANHLGSESCAGVGNGVGEAWTGGGAGWVGSLEI